MAGLFVILQGVLKFTLGMSTLISGEKQLLTINRRKNATAYVFASKKKLTQAKRFAKQALALAAKEEFQEQDKVESSESTTSDAVSSEEEEQEEEEEDDDDDDEEEEEEEDDVVLPPNRRGSSSPRRL